jgi:integrase
MKFTARSIDSLKPEVRRYIAWKDNGNGLGVRVSPNGSKSFVFMYRFNNKPRMMTLGKIPQTKLADAGLLHTAAQKLLDEGVDPAAKKIEAKEEYKAANTMSEFFDNFFLRWAQKNKKSWKEDERIFTKDIRPHIGNAKLVDLKRKDIIALIDIVVDRGAPVAANRLLACIRKILNHAVEKDIIETSPCYGIKAPSKEKARDRVLSQEEIIKFWHALDSKRVILSREIRIALKLVIVTAQRTGEVMTAEWSEIDFKNRIWTIPSEKAKNGLSHRVSLSELAIELLEELKGHTGQYNYILPNRDDKSTHVTEWVFSGGINKNFEQFEIEKKFNPYDLRRTAASHMTSMGINRLVVSKILNHADKGVTAVYDRHSYDKEKKHALDAWGAQLEKIVDGKNHSNIVEIKAS